VLDTAYDSSLTFQDLYKLLCKHEVLVFRDYIKTHPVPKGSFELYKNDVLGNYLFIFKLIIKKILKNLRFIYTKKSTICPNGTIQRCFLNSMLFMVIINIVKQASYFVEKLIFLVDKFKTSFLEMQDVLKKPSQKCSAYLYVTDVKNLPDSEVMKYIRIIILYLF
jgi:hypothetical protein